MNTSEDAEQIASRFTDLRKEMDRFVVGHELVKTGLILGMVAREHIYIEGPPGMAKTMLAEIVSAASNLGFYLYQFHRDTRLAELVGDIVIQREQQGEDGELIVQSIRRGGVLTAELCVLDDISRSPGEALNVLLRILNERQFQEEPIPLLTAIATSNPTLDDYYNEPLDPANLDRFTIQLRSAGLIHENQWEKVRQVIDLYATPEFSRENIKPKATLSRAIFDEAYELLHQVRVPDNVKKALIDLLSKFVNQYKLNPSNSLITDRSFLVKTVKILKAQAILSGRIEVLPEDLHILPFVTTFRLPDEVNHVLPELIRDAIQRVA